MSDSVKVFGGVGTFFQKGSDKKYYPIYPRMRISVRRLRTMGE